MDDATKEVVVRWLNKADNDLKNIANNLASADVPTDTVCFHAQQAIEKCLKALLISRGCNVGKTHDLVKLATECADILPAIEALEEELESISDYGVAVRYPDGFCDPTLEEARHVYEIALTVRGMMSEVLV